MNVSCSQGVTDGKLSVLNVWLCTPGEARCVNVTTLESCSSDGFSWGNETCQYGCNETEGACGSQPELPPEAGDGDNVTGVGPPFVLEIPDWIYDPAIMGIIIMAVGGGAAAAAYFLLLKKKEAAWKRVEKKYTKKGVKKVYKPIP